MTESSNKKQSLEEFKKEYFEQNKKQIKADRIDEIILYIMFVIVIVVAFIVYVEVSR